MRRIVIFLALVGVGVYSFLVFKPLQIAKYFVVEKWYEMKLAENQESHETVRNLVSMDIQNAKSGSFESGVLTEMEKNLKNEEESLTQAQDASKLISNMSLPEEYKDVVAVSSEADGIRKTAFETWAKTVTMWKRVRELVTRFEAARKSVEETAVAFKTEGVTGENIERMKKSLDEIESVRLGVEELSKEDMLTRDLIAFFNQAGDDFARLSKIVQGLENNQGGVSEKLTAGISSPVQGVSFANQERILSDWIEKKVLPGFTETQVLWEKEKALRVRRELLKEEIARGDGSK